MNDSDKLVSMSQDIEENLIPTHKSFFRHFIVHEKDFLKILHLSIKSLKDKQQEPKPSSTEQQPTTSNTEQQSTGAGNNRLEEEEENSKKYLEKKRDLLNSSEKTSNTMNEENDKLSKRIKNIIKNNNLSPDTKTEIIHDLIITTQKKKILAIERDKIPSRNSMLLSGAGNNSEQQTSFASAKNNNDKHSDDNNDDHNNCDDDSDNNSDDHSIDHRSDDNRSDDHGNQNNVDSDALRHNNDSPNRRDILISVKNKIKNICTTNNIKISKNSIATLDKISRKIEVYLCLKCKSGVESKDRKFILTSTGTIIYHDYDDSIKMGVKKLLATLSLSTNELFAFLQAISRKKNNSVTAYSSREKRFLTSFAKLASIHPGLISCFKVRKLCI